MFGYRTGGCACEDVRGDVRGEVVARRVFNADGAAVTAARPCPGPAGLPIRDDPPSGAVRWSVAVSRGGGFARGLERPVRIARAKRTAVGHGVSPSVRKRASRDLTGSTAQNAGAPRLSYRTTRTGTLEWVRTLVVSLPRSTPLRPFRPWEAITIRSQRFFFAVAMIASHGMRLASK